MSWSRRQQIVSKMGYENPLLHCAKSPKTRSILTTNFDNLISLKNDESFLCIDNELRLNRRKNQKIYRRHCLFVRLLLPTLRRCRGLLLHLITLTDTNTSTQTHTYSVGLLWTSDRSVADTCTLQHRTPTTDRHQCSRRDSNTESQQANCRRPTP